MFFIIVFIRSFLDENQCCVPVAYCSSNFFLIPLLLLLASSENPIYCVCINKGAQQTTIADGLKGLKHNSFLGQSFFLGGGRKTKKRIKARSYVCNVHSKLLHFGCLKNIYRSSKWPSVQGMKRKDMNNFLQKTSITLKLFYRAGALWSSGYGGWHKFERSWVRIPTPYTWWTFFSHWIVVKIVLFVWKDWK